MTGHYAELTRYLEFATFNPSEEQHSYYYTALASNMASTPSTFTIKPIDHGTGKKCNVGGYLAPSIGPATANGLNLVRG